jgi:hypothetical protein
MKEIKSKAIITNDHKLKIIKRKEFDDFIKTEAPGNYQLILKKIYNKRSIHQNAFYWGPFLDAELTALYDEGYHFQNKDYLHEWNKKNFSTEKLVNELTGEVIDIIIPTSSKSTVQFEIIIENIRLTFRENYNCELPYPNNEEL